MHHLIYIIIYCSLITIIFQCGIDDVLNQSHILYLYWLLFITNINQDYDLNDLLDSIMVQKKCIFHKFFKLFTLINSFKTYKFYWF